MAPECTTLAIAAVVPCLPHALHPHLPRPQLCATGRFLFLDGGVDQKDGQT